MQRGNAPDKRTFAAKDLVTMTIMEESGHAKDTVLFDNWNSSNNRDIIKSELELILAYQGNLSILQSLSTPHLAVSKIKAQEL